MRRLVALAAFGFIAHACFGFNVLLGYAAWGLPLLLARRWSVPSAFGDMDDAVVPDRHGYS